MYFVILLFTIGFTVAFLFFLKEEEWNLRNFEGPEFFFAGVIGAVFALFGTMFLLNPVAPWLPKEYVHTSTIGISHTVKESIYQEQEDYYTIDYSVSGNDTTYYFKTNSEQPYFELENITFIVGKEYKDRAVYDVYKTSENWHFNMWSRRDTKDVEIDNLHIYSHYPVRLNQVRSDTRAEN